MMMLTLEQVAGAKDREERRAMRRASGVIEGRPGIIEDTHIDPLGKEIDVSP